MKSSKSKKVLAKQEQAKQEQAKQEQAKQEQVKQGQAKQEQAKQEQKQEQAKQEQEAQHPLPSVPNPQRIHTVIARNLYREIQMEELYQGFGIYGTIKDIYMPKNMDQNSPYFGTFKGFALIKYSNPLESARAVAAGPLYYQHKTITIEFAKADR